MLMRRLAVCKRVGLLSLKERSHHVNRLSKGTL